MKENQKKGQEKRKRKREHWAIGALCLLLLGLSAFEYQLTRASSNLPFEASIFFFGLINLNVIILIAICWLIVRNVSKLMVERKRNILGASLKSKLVLFFAAFSVIPTIVLFTISALYINSTFDKWFSLKIQNTLEGSLEITRTYYRNAEKSASHFGEHIASQIRSQRPDNLAKYLESQRKLLALDAVEFYSNPLSERVLTTQATRGTRELLYPRLATDVLDRAFSGERVPVIHHIGKGDLVRSLIPIEGKNSETMGVIVVSNLVPVSLVNKVDEISSVFQDYKDTNPLKYPVKSAYFVILIMISLVIVFVAIWLGLHLAKHLTDPIEQLVKGAEAVGSGNLDIQLESMGQSEVAKLIETFNHMTLALKENRHELERRRTQLEAVLASIGTGVLVVDSQGQITTCNHVLARLFDLQAKQVIGKSIQEIFAEKQAVVLTLFGRALVSHLPEVLEWDLVGPGGTSTLIGTATRLIESGDDSVSDRSWGVVITFDDVTHVVKGQREMAWREVARRIAHEIKNPLTPIKLSAQRLQRRLTHFSGREYALLKECTDTIVQHTDELKEMVNEFSNFARFPEISPALHSFNAMVEEVARLYMQAHGDLEFKLNCDQRMPDFFFDRDQIKRVLINVLDNSVAALRSVSLDALKVITIETHFHSGLNIAAVMVRDNGPGIPEDSLGRVFEPYFSTKQEGTGLGLAIAKRIVNDHNGIIRVQSSSGQGAQFTIELPTTLRQDRAGLEIEHHATINPSH